MGDAISERRNIGVVDQRSATFDGARYDHLGIGERSEIGDAVSAEMVGRERDDGSDCSVLHG